MAKTELTCMCMVVDRDNNKVLVQDRKKNWKGITFPGGHVEDGESLIEATIREIKEETGLSVSSLVPCGVMHWYNDRTGDRYFVFNYRTESFTGSLLPETDEGAVYWVGIDELPHLALADRFRERLPMFLEGRPHEGFGVWNEDNRRSEMMWL